MNLHKKIKVKVTKRTALTSEIDLFRLENTTLIAELASFTAGSHIEVTINAEFIRAYSLCNKPSNAPQYYEIAVKREESGKGGSVAFHKLADEGQVFEVTQPQNYFELSMDADHHLLIGGGIGLTPIIAMAESLYEDKKSFSIVACAKNEEHLPFNELLIQSGWPVNKFTNGRASIDLSLLLENLPSNTHVYCCGPEGFISMMHDKCLSIPTSQWHEESFTSKEVTSSDTYQLHLSKTNKTLTVDSSMTMIDALKASSIPIETVCEQGICGSCLVEWTDGNPTHNDQCLDESERETYVAVCCAGCQSSSLTLAL